MFCVKEKQLECKRKAIFFGNQRKFIFNITLHEILFEK